MKYFSLFLLVFLTSCSTINEEIFTSYEQSVNSSLEEMENQINKIYFTGQSLYSLEASLELQDILDIELVRNSPYEVEYRENPFFHTIGETLNSVKTFNSFYNSYSKILLGIATDDMGLNEAIASYNSSLKSISEDLELSDDVVNASIDTTSIIGNFVFERITYNARVLHLQEISRSSTELVINILNIYLDIIDDLEFTMNDYYSRYYFHLENMLALGVDDNFRRREISDEIIELTINHERNVDDLLILRNSLESLKQLEIELNERIINEDLGDEGLQDFIIRNYELYEELQ